MRSSPALFILLTTTGLPPAAAQEAAPTAIGSRLEPLWDDALLQEIRGAALTLHAPVPREIVMEFDAPWEGWVSNFVTVFRDGDVVRMYYRGNVDGKQKTEITCTATSPDGVRWTRPNLGLHEFNGSKENNILLAGDDSHSFAPFVDENPAAAADARYKAVAAVPLAPGVAALVAYGSPDGIRWRKLRPEPVITNGKFDSLNTAGWDTLRKKYVCYSRDFVDKIRVIQRCESDDFLTWTEPVPLAYDGDPPSDHLYTNAIRPYFRAPHLYLGMPMRFVPERKVLPDDPEPGVSDAVFMTSRDGIRWRRFPEAWIRPGLEPEAWADRAKIPAWGVLQTGDAELSIYWTEVYRNHTSRLRRGTLRLDGFASAYAPRAGGGFTTKLLTFEGAKLHLNCATSAAGSVRVEIRDAAGKPVEGFALEDSAEIYGNGVDRVVRWKGGDDVSRLAGRPVRLRFEMKDADLFSFQFMK